MLNIYFLVFSPATVIEPSSPSTESNPIEPQIEATSQRDPEIKSNLERSVSPKASTSTDFHVSRSGRRIRRKLDQSLSGDTHIPLSGTEAKVCNIFAYYNNNNLLI